MEKRSIWRCISYIGIFGFSIAMLVYRICSHSQSHYAASGCRRLESRTIASSRYAAASWYLGDLQIAVFVFQGLNFSNLQPWSSPEKNQASCTDTIWSFQELERSSFVSSDREGGLIASLLVLDLSCNFHRVDSWYLNDPPAFTNMM